MYCNEESVDTNANMVEVCEQIDLKLISKLVTIVKSRPHGLDLMDIPLEFHRNYGYFLDPTEYESANLYEFCKEVEARTNRSIYVAEPDQSNHLKIEFLCLDQNAYEKWLNEYKNDENILALETLCGPVMARDAVRQHKTQMRFASLPKEALSGHSIIAYSVDVTHLETPNEIYVRLKNDKLTYLRLRSLMRFYDGCEEDQVQYGLPEELVVIGYKCAVRNPLDWDNWHRAIIIDTFLERVTLFAIDFGNVIIEERKHLRLLKTSMFAYPPMVTRVSLYGVAPIDDSNWWSEEAVDYLKAVTARGRTKSHNKTIKCAFLYNLESFGSEVFSVTLFYDVDVSKEDMIVRQPIYLHEKLIQTGLAALIFDDFSHIMSLNFSDRCTDWQSDDSQSGSDFDQKAINYNKLFLTDTDQPNIKIRQMFANTSPIVEREMFTADKLRSFPYFELKKFDNKKSKEMLRIFRNNFMATPELTTKRKFCKEDESGCVRSLVFGNRVSLPVAANEYSRQLDNVFSKFMTRKSFASFK